MNVKYTSLSKEQWIRLLRKDTLLYTRRFENRVVTKSTITLSLGRFISNSQERYSQLIFIECEKDKRDKSFLLDKILLMNYASYIVFLEQRNKYWKYTTMDFGRRIGELWEPFCILPFQYPINNIELIEPPDFAVVKEKQVESFTESVMSMQATSGEKEALIKKYKDIFDILSSGKINLELDLHFTDHANNYNIDFKSSFNSNEKGNASRLLMISSIYLYLNKNNRQVLLVREKEDGNNDYLKELRESKKFEVYCSENAYSKILEYTGYNIKKWIDDNIDWENDMSKEFYNYLTKHGLTKYLVW